MYPEYAVYSKSKPSVVKQEFIFISEIDSEKDSIFYPKFKGLDNFFESYDQIKLFSKARFCGFLKDTITIEHHIVIPSIISSQYIFLKLPNYVSQDLYKIITDEGHHAAQAKVFMDSIINNFLLRIEDQEIKPVRFLNRIRRIKDQLTTDYEKNLADVIAGIITETKISFELGEFAKNEDLSILVRGICHSHQSDEAIHSSQFRALGKWFWERIDKKKRQLVAKLFALIIVELNLPNLRRLSLYLQRITGKPFSLCRKTLEEILLAGLLEEEMDYSITPTIRFLTSIGITDEDEFKKTYTNIDMKKLLY